MPCLPGRSTRVHCKFASSYAKRFGNFVSLADFVPGLDLVACSLALDCRLAFAVTARADYLVANVVQVHDGDTITVSLAGLC